MKQENTYDVFQAVADPTRRHIVSMLARADMPAGDIAGQIGGMSRPAVVKHLNILRDAGIVVTHAQGRKRINQLNPDKLKLINDWLEEMSRFWDARLTTLKTIIEESNAQMEGLGESKEGAS